MQAESSVNVDRDFARFGNKSFAINKINTVEVRARHPHSRSAFFSWGLLAVVALLVFAGGNKAANANGAAIFLCLVFGFLAFRAWLLSKIIEYQLFLVTSSGAVQAIKSRDGSRIEGLRDRIEQAMAGRLD